MTLEPNELYAEVDVDSINKASGEPGRVLIRGLGRITWQGKRTTGSDIPTGNYMTSDTLPLSIHFNQRIGAEQLPTVGSKLHVTLRW